MGGYKKWVEKRGAGTKARATPSQESARPVERAANVWRVRGDLRCPGERAASWCSSVSA